MAEMFLPEACKVGVYCRTSTGTERYFAFCLTRIWEFNQTSYQWDDVTGPDGVYAGTDWSVIVWGGYVIAQNGSDPEQYIDINTGTTFLGNATAPVAKYLAGVGDFVVRGSISGAPNKVQWSALNDFQSNSAGLDGSDFQVFPEGEEVMGIIPMSFGAIIAMRSAFHAMQFALQSEFVFQFSPISKNKGTQSPFSIAILNRDDFVVYCTDGFMRGPSFTPIGANKVDAWFAANTDFAGRSGMAAMVDPTRKIVWFKHQNVNSDYRLLGYHWELDRWTYSDMQVQAMFRARTLGVTIDGMDSYFSTIDDGEVPIDSPAYDGGVEQCAVITEDGYLGFISGVNLAARLTSNELGDVNRMFVNGARLDGDAVGVSVVQSVADYKGGTLTEKAARSPSSRTRFIPLRGDGRVHRFQMDVAAGDEWSIISGLDVDVKGSGRS